MTIWSEILHKSETTLTRDLVIARDFIAEQAFLRNLRGFHRRFNIYDQGCILTGNAYPSKYMVPSNIGLAY